MPTEHGVILQTIPKGLADVVDHYAVRYELTSEQTIRAMATCFHMLHEQNHHDLMMFMRKVSDQAKREREASLILIGGNGSL